MATKAQTKTMKEIVRNKFLEAINQEWEEEFGHTYEECYMQSLSDNKEVSQEHLGHLEYVTKIESDQVIN